jgi:hypothetical protein
MKPWPKKEVGLYERVVVEGARWPNLNVSWVGLWRRDLGADRAGPKTRPGSRAEGNTNYIYSSRATTQAAA